MSKFSLLLLSLSIIASYEALRLLEPSTPNPQFQNLPLELTYQTLRLGYRRGKISHPRQGFVLTAAVGGQDVGLVLDFLNTESFVLTQSVPCSDATLCRKLDRQLHRDWLYNKFWRGDSAELEFLGGADLTLSLVDRPQKRWYYKDGFGQLSLGPGSRFWEWLRESAQPTEDYFVTFDYNCDYRYAVGYDVSTRFKVSKICKDSKVTLGAPKPDTPLVPLEGQVSDRDTRTTYHAWIATGITAQVPYTAPETNAPPPGTVPEVLKLIEPTDKVCIVPDGDFFMISDLQKLRYTGPRNVPDLAQRFLNVRSRFKAHIFWLTSALATVCPGNASQNQDCSQNGDDVSTGPVVTMTIGGGEEILIRPEEYLVKVDQGAIKLLQVAFSFVNMLPLWLTSALAINARLPFMSNRSPCPEASVALGKHFLGKRSWTIGADKTFSQFSFTFGPTKIPDQE